MAFPSIADVLPPILSFERYAMQFRQKMQEVKAIPRQIEFVVTVSVIAVVIALIAIAISIDTRGKHNAH